jgi:hypothetical protein
LADFLQFKKIQIQAPALPEHPSPFPKGVQKYSVST